MFGKSSLGLLFLVLLAMACDKDDTIPYSDAPEIVLLGISHDTVVQYDTAVIISIEYKDGDGDIGYESPDKYALFVRDTRLENFDGFYIGPVAPPGVSVPISGRIDIEFPNLFIFGNGNSEKTQFEIKMVDRAGHQSNSLMTDPVVILRD
jgi:hypothetical protein